MTRPSSTCHTYFELEIARLLFDAAEQSSSVLAKSRNGQQRPSNVIYRSLKLAKRRLLLAMWFCANPLLTSANVPPEYIELTPPKIKAMGFKYTIWKKGAFSFINLKFPPHVDEKLTPHSVQVTTTDLHGNLLLHSMSWASERHLLVVNRYNHQQTDISVSITFCAAIASSCKDFGIASVSNFINGNVKPTDILPE